MSGSSKCFFIGIGLLLHAAYSAAQRKLPYSSMYNFIKAAVDFRFLA